MISFDLPSTINALSKQSDTNSEKILSGEQIFESSPNPHLQALKDENLFWHSEPNQSQISANHIFKTLNHVKNYLENCQFYDEEIEDINLRIINGFYLSIRDFKDKKLTDLMIIFLNYISNIANIIEGSPENYQEYQKVKKSLLIFPGTSGDMAVDFACIDGSIARIGDAAIALRLLSPDQQIVQDEFFEEIIKLTNKTYPKSIIKDGNQQHLLAFLFSLFLINDEDIEKSYRSVDSEIYLRDALKIMQSFKAKIRIRIENFNKQISDSSSISDFSTKWLEKKSLLISGKDSSTQLHNIELIELDTLEQQNLDIAKKYFQESVIDGKSLAEYFLSVQTIETKILMDYCQNISENLGIDILVRDLFKTSDNDELIFTDENCILAYKNQLKTTIEIRKMFEEKLCLKFPQLTTDLTEELVLPLIDPKSHSLAIFDEYDYLESLNFKKNQRDEIDPYKIDNIMGLLFPDKEDPNATKKVKAGLLFLHSIHRNFKNSDFILSLLLSDKIREMIKDSDIKNFALSLPPELAVQNPTRILQYCDFQDANRFREIFDLSKNIFKENQEIDHRDNALKIYEIYKKIYSNQRENLEEIIEKTDSLAIETMLFIALRCSHVAIFKLLTKQKPESKIKLAQIKDDKGNNAFHITISNSDVDLTMAIIEEIPDSQIEPFQSLNNEGLNPLHLAIINEEVTILQLILKKAGAEKIRLLKITDSENFSPLHIACYGGHENIVKIILDETLGNEDEILLISNSQNFTPLHVATYFGHQEVVETILDRSGRRKKTLLGATTIENNTALHIAIQRGHLKIAKTLLKISQIPEFNELLEIVNIEGKTPFSLAIEKKSLSIVLLMIENASENFSQQIFLELINSKTKDGKKILHCAFENNDHLAIKKLLNFAKIISNDKFDNLRLMLDENMDDGFETTITPFQFSIENQNPQSVRAVIDLLKEIFLTEKDFVVELFTKTSDEARTPLSLASGSSHLIIFKELINFIEFVGNEDKGLALQLLLKSSAKGLNCLHFVCKDSELEFLSMIIDSIDKFSNNDEDLMQNYINQENIKKKTPLYYAIKRLFQCSEILDDSLLEKIHNNKEIVIMLLKKGARENQEIQNLMISNQDNPCFKDMVEIFTKYSMPMRQPSRPEANELMHSVNKRTRY